MAFFVHRETGELHPKTQELIELVAEDADVLGCSAEIARLPEILARGTSSHRQLQVFEKALAAGASQHEALGAVVQWLVAETALVG
jgi:carboxylate-amine ligase